MFYVLLIVSVTLMAGAQIVIKTQLNSLGAGSVGLWALGLNLLRNPYLWLALGMLIVAAGLWYGAMRWLPLNVVFFFAALAYPMILLGSYLFLDEAVSRGQILGCAMIVGGVLIVANG